MVLLGVVCTNPSILVGVVCEVTLGTKQLIEVDSRLSAKCSNAELEGIIRIFKACGED